jgi:hypothetical protein
MRGGHEPVDFFVVVVSAFNCSKGYLFQVDNIQMDVAIVAAE